ncbi:hypothetical protein VJY32_00120 [Ignavibacteria bacterium 4148-Me]|uniref:hypothetical protein n=1 Tax=Rosettibacter primus TaxID=3111523 RepID=UPI00336BC6D6
MPHYSLFLKLKVFLKEFYRKIKYGGNKYNVYNAYKNKLLNKRLNIFPSIMISGLEQPEFFEYYFSHKAFLQFFNLPNLEILEHFTSFGKDGLFFIFKKFIGRWDYSRSQVKLNLLGKIIHSFLPKKLYNLHNVVVAKRIT